MLGEQLSAEAPGVNNVFQPTARLTGVGDDGQIVFQHARLMAAAQQLEIDLLMAMPPHEREARFRSARVESILIDESRRQALLASGLESRTGDRSVYVFRLSERSREARMKEGEYTWSFLPEADLPMLQNLTVAQFKNRHVPLHAKPDPQLGVSDQAPGCIKGHGAKDQPRRSPIGCRSPRSSGRRSAAQSAPDKYRWC